MDPDNPTGPMPDPMEKDGDAWCRWWWRTFAHALYIWAAPAMDQNQERTDQFVVSVMSSCWNDIAAGAVRQNTQEWVREIAVHELGLLTRSPEYARSLPHPFDNDAWCRWWWDRFSRMVFSLACYRLYDRHAADDIVGEVLADCFHQRDSIRSWASFPGFVSRVAMNKISRKIRGIMREPESREAISDATAHDSNGPAHKAEVVEEVRAALECLSSSERAVIIAYYTCDEVAKAAADALGIPASTYRTQLQRALNHLRERLGMISDEEEHSDAAGLKAPDINDEPA